MGEMTKTKAKPLRRRKRRGSMSGMSEPEKIIRAVQSAAAAVTIAYKVIKPHIHKLKRKMKNKKGPVTK